MFTEAEVAEFRADAEDRMTDTCRITKPGTGKGTLDPDTLKRQPPPRAVVYEGPCRIPRRDSPTASSASAGEATWQVGEYPLALPIGDTADVAPDMTVEYLTAQHDPALVGRVFGITAVSQQSLAIERRFRMKTVVGGGS
ncbi:DUF6093 family protein [Nocardioides sp. SOB77]|uniref:DUF6093 family protein n=1 Tax=Nocardioides oceani TaxID=3058369 RepID=A0ABT8FJN8_9ACTN|nr:DUF6093 family protein [Nocardioides oceani]MDN4174731.1 DUF6093 family protein [Nocardioides oceani]